ncbi:hypothetical protein EMCRGX_G022804 [Ephydatia muelleri]
MHFLPFYIISDPPEGCLPFQSWVGFHFCTQALLKAVYPCTIYQQGTLRELSTAALELGAIKMTIPECGTILLSQAIASCTLLMPPSIKLCKQFYCQLWICRKLVYSGEVSELVKVPTVLSSFLNQKQLFHKSGQRLGYASIRLNQLNAIKSFMEGNDIFVILPTGSGKSLCFTVLPFAFDCLYQRDSSIVIVVSPLIALMKDQVATLNSKGLSAAYLSSEMNDRAQQERILRGEVQVLYIGPELLMLNTLWRDMLTTPVYKENLVAFVVDEAHCVAKRGDYFRQEFKYLGAVRSLIPSHVHVMALTATATVATRDTVVKILGMNSPTIVSASPDKPNICYAVREKGNIEEEGRTLLTVVSFLPFCNEI